MTQSALTVTTPNPTPPTNMSFVGATPPTDPAQAYFDDAAGGIGAPGVFAPKTAAAGAGTSVDAEARGAETSFTQSYSSAIYNPAGALSVFGVGPANPAAPTMPTPNASHASSLSPLTNPALTSIAPPSVASGVGTQLLTATGTAFTRQSVLVVNGVAQPTTYVSPTSITATVTKKTAAGTWPVVVRTGGVVDTAPQTWTFT